MKKIIVLAMAFVMVLGLASCGKDIHAKSEGVTKAIAKTIIFFIFSTPF